MRTYRPFSEGLAKVGVNGRCAYVDKTGKIVVELPAVECKATDDLIPPKDPDNYLSMMNLELVGAVDFHDGRAFYNPPDTPCVYLIDRQGRVVTDTPFTDARSFAEGRAFVRIRDKWALIDTEGRVITGPAFDYLEKYVSLTSLTSLRTLPLFYYYDRYRKGDGFYRFRDGLAKVQIDGKLAYVDREGRIVWRQGG